MAASRGVFRNWLTTIASDTAVLEQILQSLEKECYSVLGRDLIGIQSEVIP